MPDFSDLRERMVKRQIEARGVRDPLILNAFRAIPREAFVSSAHAAMAYEDHPIPIEAGQTVSQPYIVALMIEQAEIRSGDRVLEVGSGSGYAAAVIGLIAAEVIGVERQPDLVQVSSERLRCLGYDKVRIVEGDGSLGLPDQGPFDAILVAASGSHVPRQLIDQLVVGGRLVMPLGGPHGAQELVKITKRADGAVCRQSLGGVRFVPLIGVEGWHSD